MSYRCCAFPLDPEAIAHYAQQLGCSTIGSALDSLAHAVALHPMWQDLAQGILVVRANPTPVLALLGTFSPKQQAQINLQRASVNAACRRLRYIDRKEAIATCEQLAERLTETFGPLALREFRFYGVPRGGLIVLGWLAYVLDLRPLQLEPPYPPDIPLVMVDDCALSGSRFSRVLKQFPQHQLIGAPLYAHPDLCTAICTHEPQLLACINGIDLHDHGPQILGNAYHQWQTQNLARLAGDRYWLGLPDYIAFDWNEPDHLLWNPATQTLETSWKIVPPQLCLKNRLSQGAPSLPIQIQPPCQGWLHPSSNIVYGTLQHQILIGDLSTGETFGLSGKAAQYWNALLQSISLDQAIATLNQQQGMTKTQLQDDLDPFIAQLLAQKIVQHAN